MRVGALDVSILVDGEGSLATVAEVFPALNAAEVWRLPVNADPDLVYVSDHDADLAAATRKQVLGRLADRGADVIVSHFHGPGRFSRRGEGFSCSSLAKEGEAAVE